jgi:hypothetical protein
VKGKKKLNGDCDPTQVKDRAKIAGVLNPKRERTVKNLMRVLNYFNIYPFFLYPFPLFDKAISFVSFLTTAEHF